MIEEQSGFLGRWSRRKTDVLQGKAVEEPVVTAPPVQTSPAANGRLVEVQEASETPPSLSLDDVELLTQDSDFKPFMAQNVNLDVRNAAMKKLFADPHFNVMDGLDIYIDDYSKSDPIPESMLRAMTSSKFLGLFDEEEDAEKTGDAVPVGDNAGDFVEQSVAQSDAQVDAAAPDSAPEITLSQPELLPDGGDSVASHNDHDNPHLRLQPDHAASATEAGRGS